ncbi:zf-HC2 domain-containing protein [Candidatus Bipolaricaulota bacterium]|nr:zf-HC2 domain-containing protein [Candidatus Bipolaricaulota bacterium]
MTDCAKIRELLSWYANKTLSRGEAQAVAQHLASCSACRDELAQIVQLMWEFNATFAQMPSAPKKTWDKVIASTRGIAITQLDVGSFLLGISLGLSVPRTGLPRVRSDLRFFGQKIKLFDNQKGGTQ